jgi:HlyD family secretion protein
MNRTPLVAAAVVIAGLGTYALWSRSTPPALSAGIAQANGRIEVERVDIATKSAGRDRRTDGRGRAARAAGIGPGRRA